MKRSLALCGWSVLILGLVACSSKRKRVSVPVKKEMVEKPVKAGEKVEIKKEKKSEMPHWSHSGKNGADKWGELSPFYIQCSDGKRQSPIDLIWKKPVSGGAVGRRYQAASYKVKNNGHAVQLDVAGAGEAVIHGQTYSLVQLHFHSPSEHTVSGVTYPLEVHFVHKNHEGELAVLGAFYNVGAKNAVLEKIWSQIPATGKENKAGELMNPESLLPRIGTHYKYSGSLTTPPCSEGVNWIVYNTPMELSRGQLEAFRKFYKSNARPVQPLNGREVTNY